MRTKDVINGYSKAKALAPVHDITARRVEETEPFRLYLEEAGEADGVGFPHVEYLRDLHVYGDYKTVIEEALLGDNPTQKAIAQQGLILTALLIAKNRNYGNSALEPMAVFARDITTKTRMGVRMDDKINRIARGLNTADGEDAVRDLAGYLVLWLAGEQTGALG